MTINVTFAGKYKITNPLSKTLFVLAIYPVIAYAPSPESNKGHSVLSPIQLVALIYLLLLYILVARYSQFTWSALALLVAGITVLIFPYFDVAIFFARKMFKVESGESFRFVLE